jgi:hypothetical protein
LELKTNTELTRAIHTLTKELHREAISTASCASSLPVTGLGRVIGLGDESCSDCRCPSGFMVVLTGVWSVVCWGCPKFPGPLAELIAGGSGPAVACRLVGGHGHGR